jgi:hypothetical protein
MHDGEIKDSFLTGARNFSSIQRTDRLWAQPASIQCILNAFPLKINWTSYF